MAGECLQENVPLAANVVQTALSTPLFNFTVRDVALHSASGKKSPPYVSQTINFFGESIFLQGWNAVESGADAFSAQSQVLEHAEEKTGEI